MQLKTNILFSILCGLRIQTQTMNIVTVWHDCDPVSAKNWSWRTINDHVVPIQPQTTKRNTFMKSLHQIERPVESHRQHFDAWADPPHLWEPLDFPTKNRHSIHRL